MKKIDIFLLTPILLLTFFGLFMIYDASSYVSFKDFGDKYHFIKEQLFWAVLGFTGLSFFSLFSYKKLYNLAVPILIAAIILLLLVFVPGLGLEFLGAKRWINLGFSSFQPSEFVKLGLAIYLAAWFSNKEKGRFLAFILLLSMVFALIILEPDFGTAIIVLAEALSIYFLSGANLFYFIFIAPVVFVLGIILIKFEPYRAKRLATFLDFNQAPSTFSYHVRQILIALGSGGITGVGIGNSIQKFSYLPENTTDSIFAIIAEEVGFVGSLLVILVFISFIWRGFYIATKARDNFGKLLAGGITTFLAVQVIINLAAQTALLPLTGVPLPFVSYGGSALIVDLSAIGILLNISKENKV